MNQEELNTILDEHKRWLLDDGGKMADLQRANLQRANLQGANLQGANLQGADLQRANLQRANLQRANLQGADLREADLRWADLRGADLREADLRWADLREADLDFSCLPLWCGSKGMKVDLKIVYQLLAHVACLDCEESEFTEIKEKIMPYAKKSHRAEDLL